MKWYTEAILEVVLAAVLSLLLVLLVFFVVSRYLPPSQEDNRVFILLSEPAEGAFGRGTYVEYAIDGHIYGTTVLNEKYDEFLSYLHRIAKE